MSGTATIVLGIAYIYTQDDIYFKMNWWDKIYTFPVGYTDIIDSILIREGNIINRIPVGQNIYTPGLGYHYYPYHGYWITLQKRETDDEDKRPYYRCYVWNLTSKDNYDKTYRHFEKTIFELDPNKVETIHISGAGFKTTTTSVYKLCSSEQPTQTFVLNEIMKQYTEHHNTAFLLTGAPGTRKSYTARLLKKRLDEIYGPGASKLYDDFNPSAIGVDITEVALKYAAATSPVIIVIDEVDKCFEETRIVKQNIMGKTSYTDNKHTFNNLIDTIRSINNVILLMTSNVPYDKLMECEENHSYLRTGRIDHIINMEMNTCTVI